MYIMWNYEKREKFIWQNHNTKQMYAFESFRVAFVISYNEFGVVLFIDLFALHCYYCWFSLVEILIPYTYKMNKWIYGNECIFVVIDHKNILHAAFMPLYFLMQRTQDSHSSPARRASTTKLKKSVTLFLSCKWFKWIGCQLIFYFFFILHSFSSLYKTFLIGDLELSIRCSSKT